MLLVRSQTAMVQLTLEIQTYRHNPLHSPLTRMTMTPRSWPMTATTLNSRWQGHLNQVRLYSLSCRPRIRALGFAGSDRRSCVSRPRIRALGFAEVGRCSSASEQAIRRRFISVCAFCECEMMYWVMLGTH